MKTKTRNSKKAPIKLVILPFEIPAKLAAVNACGGWSKKFRAAITLEVRQLDDMGFVVENQSLIANVRAYFGKAKYRASCEQLCQGIVNLSHNLVGARLTRTTVQVFNLTGYTEVVWSKGEQVPPLPHCEK